VLQISTAGVFTKFMCSVTGLFQSTKKMYEHWGGERSLFMLTNQCFQ